MQNLLLDHSCQNITRNELRRVPTPLGTKTHKPVAHSEIAELVTDGVLNRGYKIINEEYGLSASGARMFAVLRFHPNGHPEYARALGFRNSHDKSMAVGLTVGLNILVCSNMCFGGETTIHRKHTSGIEIERLLPQAFDAIDAQYEVLEERVSELKYDMLSIDEAKLVTVKAAENKAIPSCDILPVLKEFQEPQHDEFKEPSKWSLYNAFTETAKKYSPPRADKCYRTLARIFELG